MKNYWRFGFVFAFVGALVLYVSLGKKTDVPNYPFFLGGIQVNEPDQQQWVNTLDAVGMNTVSVTVYAKQGDWNSDHLWFEKEEPGVIAEIKAAKAKGLKVILILRVALDHAYEKNKFLWHGMIMPEADEPLDYWFKIYTAFTVKWAKIAQAEGVDVLAIGSEMRQLTATRQVDETPTLIKFYSDSAKIRWHREMTLQHQTTIEAKSLWVRGHSNYEDIEAYLRDKAQTKEKWANTVGYLQHPNALEQLNQRKSRLRQHWSSLIRTTRQHYKGPLTYAANFDNYQNIDFWDQLDFIGINAYFPLRQFGDTTTTELGAQLDAGWKSIYADINLLRERDTLDSKPVIFTELGYLFREETTFAPWSGFGFNVLGDLDTNKLLVWNEQAINYEERAMAMASLYRTHVQQPDVLRGILYWKLSTVKQHSEIEPFMLHVGKDSEDPLQSELAKFGRD